MPSMKPRISLRSPNLPPKIASNPALRREPNFLPPRISLRFCSTSWTLAPNINIFSYPIYSAISTFAPSIVPMIKDPFIQNFIFPVPEASKPAVDICWFKSEAGMITWALDTE